MATTWRLSSFESATDVKELIPEFFFLPEFLENTEGNICFFLVCYQLFDVFNLCNALILTFLHAFTIAEVFVVVSSFHHSECC